MLRRFTCGLVAQLSSVTSCDDACRLSRPGSPVGNRIRRLVDEDGDADAVVFRGHDVVLHEAIEHGERRGRILRERRQVAELPVGERHHLLQPLAVAPGERAQAAAEVVVQHQVPAAEQLLGEELGERAVARLVRRRRCGTDRRCCRAGRTPTVVPEK